jgi:subtilisin-like proprotein convertase family protein
MKMERQRHNTFALRLSALVQIVALCSGIFAIGNVKATSKAAGTMADYSQEPIASSIEFCNQGTIPINDNAPATPYPSSINVSGLTGSVSKVTVTLMGVQHTFPDDIDILLVGPSGQKIELMSDAGGNRSISNVDLAFDDDAPTYLSDFGTIASGTYKPSNFFEQSDYFPAPAPGASVAAPYGATLQSFNGTDPNGVWSLYVVDDCGGDAGQILGGWCLSIGTTPSGGPAPTLITGIIDKSDPIQKGRLIRNTINSLSPSLKSFPGISDSATRHFDNYAFTNQTDGPQTATATLSSACGVNLLASAYLGSYDPTNPSTNYLADNGSSFVGTGLPMSFDVPAGVTVVMVVTEITSNSGCASYSLLVEGNVSRNTTPPQITQQPNSQATPAGSSASFNVVASGAGLVYQWRKGNTVLANGGKISGVDTPNLVISPVGLGDVAPNYNVVVLGATGSATSNDAALTLDHSPAITCPGLFAKTPDCTANGVTSSPRRIEQDVLNMIVAMRALSTDKRDSDKLEDAMKHLANSIDASLWSDDFHPQAKGGEKAFSEAREAVKKLSDLIKDKHSQIPDSQLQGVIVRLALANRMIALVAISEGGDPREIEHANNELTNGDSDAAAGRHDTAMDHYRNAWNHLVK